MVLTLFLRYVSCSVQNKDFEIGFITLFFLILKLVGLIYVSTNYFLGLDMNYLSHIKYLVNYVIPFMIGNEFMMMTTNSHFEPVNYKKEVNMAMRANPYDGYNYRE